MSKISDQGAAYCAAAWASGTTQKELARQFGYKKSSTICSAIMRFLFKYHDADRVFAAYGDTRKALVPAAIKFYQRTLEMREPQSFEEIRRDVTRRDAQRAMYSSQVSMPPALKHGSTLEACYAITQYLKLGAGPIDCKAIDLDPGAFTIGAPFTLNVRGRRKAAYRKARTASESIQISGNTQ